MLILGLDATLARCSAAVVADGVLRAERREEGERAYATSLPLLLQAVLAEASVTADALDGVAVCVGPGSFTGLRAAIALASGLALASARPLVGVTVAEALVEAVPGRGASRLWVAIDNKRGGVFLHTGEGDFAAVPLAALPVARQPVLVAGDAAPAVAARLTARGEVARPSDVRLPLARHVALVGARRLAGALAPLPAQPIYVEAPAVVLPAGGLRPAPAGG